MCRFFYSTIPTAMYGEWSVVRAAPGLIPRIDSTVMVNQRKESSEGKGGAAHLPERRSSGWMAFSVKNESSLLSVDKTKGADRLSI